MPSNITEADLERRQLCPMMTMHGSNLTTVCADTYATAEKLLRWALLESFSGTVPNRRILRERFTAVWKSTYYPNMGPGVPANHPTFWQGPKLAAGIASRIHKFLLHYQVIHPEQAYALPEYDLSGSYALIRKKSSPQHYVLCYHRQRPISAPAPSASEICRWLHAKKAVFIPPGSKSTLGTYHLVLMRGASWRNDTVDEKVAREMFANIFVSRNIKVPSIGGHCKYCIMKDCLTIWTK